MPEKRRCVSLDHSRRHREKLHHAFSLAFPEKAIWGPVASVTTNGLETHWGCYHEKDIVWNLHYRINKPWRWQDVLWSTGNLTLVSLKDEDKTWVNLSVTLKNPLIGSMTPTTILAFLRTWETKYTTHFIASTQFLQGNHNFIKLRDTAAKVLKILWLHLYYLSGKW